MRLFPFFVGLFLGIAVFTSPARAARPCPVLRQVAETLHRQEPQLARSLTGYISQNPKIRTNSVEQIAQWIAVLERGHQEARAHGDAGLQAIRDFYHREYVIQESEIPDAYYRLQQRIAREQGRGNIEINAQTRQQMARALVHDQRESLDRWIDYFLSPDTDTVPFSLKILAFRDIARRSVFDESTQSFPVRTRGTVAHFPELNSEALARTFDQFTSRDNRGRNARTFSQIYALETQRMLEIALRSPDQQTQTQGRWVVYPRGSEPTALVQSLDGRNTGWCTAGTATARSQLQGGDFHVFYSLDENGQATVPRIAIRMEGSTIAEVRGVRRGQHLDSGMAESGVLAEKLREFGAEGEKFELRSQHMTALTAIERNVQNGVSLTPSELQFLYEIDEPIQGFGAGRDPRIQEIRQGRNLRDDLAFMVGVGRLEDALALKNGTPQDRMRYILAMRAMESTDLRAETGSNFGRTLLGWIADPTQPFFLRQEVLNDFLRVETSNGRFSRLSQWHLPELFDHFTVAEQQVVIQSIWNTPLFRKRVLQHTNDLPGLIARVRRTPSARDPWVREYSPRYSRQITSILDDATITDEAVLRMLPEVVDSLRLGRLYSGPTPLPRQIEIQVIENYLQVPRARPALIRDLIRGLTSREGSTRQMTERVLEAALRHPELSHDSVVRELRTIHGYSSNFEEAVRRWVADPSADARLKGELLLSTFGEAGQRFTELAHLIPTAQRTVVWSVIDRHSSIRLYTDLARERNLPDSVFEGAALESFLYQQTIFPEGRGRTFTMGDGTNTREVTLTQNFEMQATQVTQLQWYLVTGENPSKFSDAASADGDHRVIGGIPLNINHPVEKVSWVNIQTTYLPRLNERNRRLGLPEERLPTAAEWEASARAGSNTPYSFGSSEVELPDYAWSYRNAQNRTHAVGMLHPSPSGLQDIHGNVSEWVQDWAGDYPAGALRDPQGPPSGALRVYRGGNWHSTGLGLRTGDRSCGQPNLCREILGLRLVRTVE